MIDFNELAGAIAGSKDAPQLRLRQGVIQSVNANGTCSVKIGGSAVTITNVKVAAHVCPIPTASCFLATDGRDWFVLATIAPQGPAYGSMRLSVAQSFTTATFTELSWANRTDTASTGTTLGSNGITTLVPGLYSVSATLTFTGNATGQRILRLLKNSTTEYQGIAVSAPGSVICRLQVAGIIKCAINDVINIDGYQSSGANLSTDISGGANRLTATWIGPVS